MHAQQRPQGSPTVRAAAPRGARGLSLYPQVIRPLDADCVERRGDQPGEALLGEGNF